VGGEKSWFFIGCSRFWWEWGDILGSEKKSVVLFLRCCKGLVFVAGTRVEEEEEAGVGRNMLLLHCFYKIKF